jgi:hypothetical protein
MMTLCFLVNKIILKMIDLQMNPLFTKIAPKTSKAHIFSNRSSVLVGFCAHAIVETSPTH